MKDSNVISMNALDASVDHNGVAIFTGMMVAMSVQVVMTGTASGALKLQFSNDGAGPGLTPTSWSDITSATVTLTGTAGVFSIQKNDLAYEWVRLVYTKNNGSAGTITARAKLTGF